MPVSFVSDVPLQLEADAVARCLIGREPTAGERARYASAVTRHNVALAGRDVRLWRRMITRPWLYNAVDGALALVQPTSPIRHRSYIMLAVLEASPAHTDLFLARARPRALVVASVLATAAAGAARAALGLAVIAVTR